METSEKNNDGQGRIIKYKETTGKTSYVIPPLRAKSQSCSSMGAIIITGLFGLLFLIVAIADGMYLLALIYLSWYYMFVAGSLIQMSATKIVLTSNELQIKNVRFSKDYTVASFPLDAIKGFTNEPLGSIMVKPRELLHALKIGPPQAFAYGVFIEFTDKNRLLACAKGTANEKRWLLNELNELIRRRCGG